MGVFMRRTVIVLALLVCVCGLNSCTTVTQLMRYLLNIPGQLLNSVTPR